MAPCVPWRRRFRPGPPSSPPDAFRLRAGQDALSQYQFGSGINQHLFCRHCGVRAFGTGRSPRWGDFYAVNLGCLDDVSDTDLASAPITYLDGRNDDWHAVLRETGHL